MTLGTVLGSGIVTGVGKILDDVITTDDERGQLAIAMEKVRQLPELKELDERIAFAQHPSIFVAGARPAAIWVGVIGIGFNVICIPLLNWAATIWLGPEFADIPALDWNELMVLAGLAGGTSWIRHMDKARGVARHNLAAPDMTGNGQLY